MENDRRIPRISEVLYVGLCDEIGTPTQVKFRRDVMDVHEIIYRSALYGYREMESGSRREGFRLKTSDKDIMHWHSGEKVICDLSQIPSYDPTQILILMECNDTPPGFAKLQLLTPTNKPRFILSCFSVDDKVYISSFLHRQYLQMCLQLLPTHQSATLHGPCSNILTHQQEFDHAFCFSCQHWPPIANKWIKRCQRQGWPSPHVLQEIIKDGCHLVAIGSGRSSQHCEDEWRMSFSQAEYKLVSSMNHTQFLCYGLLKIFLNEVLNVGYETPLLCSYFMKTTLFWKIQENTISIWCPENVLHCLWICFKYLVRCVYMGEFPNFFIPQNNMFSSKIHGVAQKQLFQQLMNLYNMGFSCLLLSPSVYKIITKAILNPSLQVCINANNNLSEVELDLQFFREIELILGYYDITGLGSIPLCLKAIEKLSKTILPSSQNQIVTLHLLRNELLILNAFGIEYLRDDHMHTTDNFTPLDMLLSAAESGYISDTLYIAMYLYNKKRYTEALYYIERTKQKFSQPYVLDSLTGYENREKYIEAVGGKSLVTKLRKTVSSHIRINHFRCIAEVDLEVFVVFQNNVKVLTVRPLVMTHMLSFLCHHRMGDRLRNRQSLDDLHALVHFQGGEYQNDISWQLLGVCEQIYGNKERALYSYQQSCKQYPLHNINTASRVRIQTLFLNKNNV